MSVGELTLSPVVGRYFDAWICWDSWESRHPLDDQRFYRFVKAVARHSRKPPSQADIRALIAKRARELIAEQTGEQIADDDELDETAGEFAELYQTLLNYEKTKGFPDPLIERTNILRYYLALSAGCQGDEQRLHRQMTAAWGQDWRSKLDRAINGLD